MRVGCTSALDWFTVCVLCQVEYRQASHLHLQLGGIRHLKATPLPCYGCAQPKTTLHGSSEIAEYSWCFVQVLDDDLSKQTSQAGSTQDVEKSVI